LKAKPIDLLISLVHQNEEICVRKATILAAGQKFELTKLIFLLMLQKIALEGLRKRAIMGKRHHQ